ncbi:MAG: hypothetical protein WBN81_00065, partial [Gammaproteobacteria bacterium]
PASTSVALPRLPLPSDAKRMENRFCLTRMTLNISSPRQKPGSRLLIAMDVLFRQTRFRGYDTVLAQLFFQQGQYAFRR